MSLRRGSAIAAVAAGSGTTRTFTFAEPVCPCWFTNEHDQAAYVRLNSTTAAAIAAGGYDQKVPAGETVDLSQDGMLVISKMAVIWAVDDPGVAYSVTGIPEVQVNQA
jgi:hypothetical protein